LLVLYPHLYRQYFLTFCLQALNNERNEYSKSFVPSQLNRQNNYDDDDDDDGNDDDYRNKRNERRDKKKSRGTNNINNIIAIKVKTAKGSNLFPNLFRVQSKSIPFNNMQTYQGTGPVDNISSTAQI
jgi:hypothetical protein